jgi:recombination protein RecT
MAKDLAARTQAQAAKQTDNPTVAQLIERMKPEIARALPSHMDPDRLARIALTVFRQTPQLAKCDPNSFLGALMTCSQLGLEPGPLGEAYLVPYGRNVTFIPGYRGLIKLAWQSGQLKNIAAHVVHEDDDFDYAYGLEPYLRHKPSLTSEGKVIAVYASAVLNNGGSAFVVMNVKQVEAIRGRSASSKSGPWVTDWDAQARKTAVKQLIRWLPLSTEMRGLATAAQLDGTTRDDVSHLEESVPRYVDQVEPQAAPEQPQPADVTDLPEVPQDAVESEPEKYVADPDSDPWGQQSLGGEQ